MAIHEILDRMRRRCADRKTYESRARMLRWEPGDLRRALSLHPPVACETVSPGKMFVVNDRADRNQWPRGELARMSHTDE
jgi:hypothetical protein